jgi:hypothetical protein
MQQDYVILSGFGPGPARDGDVPGIAKGGMPAIAILCVIVTTVIPVLHTGGTAEYRDAVPASTCNNNSPTLTGWAGFIKNRLPGKNRRTG